jgi:outer membrane protein assembly factor BamB
VFTNTGRAKATRIDLQSGKPLWIDSDKQGAALITRWRSDLLIFGDGPFRGLDPITGATKWVRQCRAGLQTAFVVGDYLVGDLAEHFHVLDLNTFEYLWKVDEFASNPLVSDGQVVVRADDDVTCYDVQTGAIRWKRPGTDFDGKAWQMGFIWRDWFFVRIGEPLLLTALELSTGRTVWRTDFPVQWCQPYGDCAYGVEAEGVYRAIELATGNTTLQVKLSRVPQGSNPKTGLIVSRESDSWPWRDSRVAVSETHAFVSKPSGQIVILARETGQVEQVVEIDGMPAGRGEPIIYENRLLLTDFNAAVYCFEGAV